MARVFALRLPESLHALLAQQAREEGVSLNQYMVYILSRAEGIREGKATVLEQKKR